jgi:hypothetical protein
MVSGANLLLAQKNVPLPENNADIRRFIKRCIFAVGVRYTICLSNICAVLIACCAMESVILAREKEAPSIL